MNIYIIASEGIFFYDTLNFIQSDLTVTKTIFIVAVLLNNDVVLSSIVAVLTSIDAVLTFP